ncbi:tyrosine-protein phosphatase [Listeria aquatica]|uniref:Tyrosine-protein phosphatase n=1 Tax=Listeria aquatica TaxID=1494960 RepID=A0A841ZM96_9LIST|nr:tyrosine-protein phosphatase [Listeria aquatica]MBC1521789.1 tyrosine-protein phosphatase [Listeria aquatica]
MKKWVKVTGIAVVGTSLLLTGCQSDKKARTSEKTITSAQMIAGEQIKLDGAVNVRDLGGYKTTDGKRIKSHRLIRSAELYKLTGEDIRKLKGTYRLHQIVDFRTNSELKEKPDPPIQGVRYTHDSIMKDNGASTSMADLTASLSKMNNPETFLIQANQSFVTDEHARQAYKEFFNILLKNDKGAVLWHCTAGKDRAGFGTALVLSALGVPEKTIMKDYLLSNKYRAAENKAAIEEISKQTDDPKVINGMKAIMDVRENYLNAAFTEINEQYGSMERFLKNGLGLTNADLIKLKSKYLS